MVVCGEEGELGWMVIKVTLGYGKAKCPNCGEVNRYTEILSCCSFMLNSAWMPPPNKCCKCDTGLSNKDVIERCPEELLGNLNRVKAQEE